MLTENINVSCFDMCELPFNAHVSDGRGRWPDEDDAFLFTRLRKLCVF